VKKDFVFTFSTQIIVLVSGLIVFKLALLQFGNTGFSEFSMVKRNIAYLYTLLLLGLGVAIPRYIAKEIGSKSGEENNVFLAACIILFYSLLTAGVLLFGFQEQITALLFGSQSFSKFIFPLFVSLAGLSLHGLFYAYYRGKMVFKTANLIQLINIGILPPIAFLFAHNTEELFLYTGFLMSAVSTPLLIYIFFTEKFQSGRSTHFIATLFKYGAQRLPADFGLASLITLPAIFTAHTEGPLIAGYVAFSMSLLSLSGQAVAPVGLIMLPKISHLLGEKNFTQMRYYIQKLLLFALGISLFGTILYQSFADQLLYLYLGHVSDELISISKQIMWGALFYPFYVTMRSVVDAYYTRAYNTISILLALGIFLLLFTISHNVFNSLVIALSILMGVTLYFIKPLLTLNKVGK